MKNKIYAKILKFTQTTLRVEFSGVILCKSSHSPVSYCDGMVSILVQFLAITRLPLVIHNSDQLHSGEP